jgi:hypothetical protein
MKIKLTVIVTLITLKVFGQVNNPIAFISNQSNVSCHFGSDGYVEIGVNNGTSPFLYSLGTVTQTSNLFSNLSDGNYSVTVTDANGLTAVAPFTITSPPQLTFTLTNTSISCNGICDGQIQITPSGGTPNYQVSLNGGPLQATNLLTGLCEGLHTILLQDSHGCQFSTIQNLIEPPSFGIDVITNISSNCGFNNGSITVLANGTNAPYTYSMYGGAIQPNGTFDNLFAGPYLITATDQSGCSASVFCGISDVEMDGIILSQSDATCNDLADGFIEVTNVGGPAPITYTLDNSGITQYSGLFLNLLPGSHTITILDAGFCAYSIPFFINEPAGIQFEPKYCCVNNSCNIEFMNVTGGSGGYQYSIDNGLTFQSGNTFTGLIPGNYNLVVKDNNECAVMGVITLSTIDIEISSFDLACFNDNSGELQIEAAGGKVPYSYSIDDGVNFQNSNTFSGLIANNYNLVVKDNFQCTVYDTVILTQPPLLTATTIVTDVNCFGDNSGEVQIESAGGTGAYLYSINNGLTFQSDSIFSGLTAGVYTYIVKDSNNCITASNFDVLEPSLLTLNGVTTDASINDGTIFLTGANGTSPYTYSLNGVDYSSSGLFTNLLPQSYTCYVQDGNGCIESIELTINTLSINELDKNGVQQINLYPNPTSNLISVEIYGFKTNRVKFKIVDLNGKFISESIFEIADESLNQSIELNNKLPAGQYLLEIYDGEILNSTAKIIKQ